MNNYYFTFGQSHIDTKGNFLKDSYVKVKENNYTTARIKFQLWANKSLAHPDHWAFQYIEKDFRLSFCPDGLYAEL